MLFPASVVLLLGLEQLLELLCVFTPAAEAIDFHALVLQLCPLLGVLLRALLLCSTASFYSALFLISANSSKSFSKPSTFKNEG